MLDRVKIVYIKPGPMISRLRLAWPDGAAVRRVVTQANFSPVINSSQRPTSSFPPLCPQGAYD